MTLRGVSTLHEVQGWSVTLHSEAGMVWAALDLVEGLRIPYARVLGIENINSFQHLSVTRVDGEFCVIGGTLHGGGAKHSKSLEEGPTEEFNPYLRRTFSECQSRVEEIANSINEHSNQGIFSEYRLSGLQNISLATIEQKSRVIWYMLKGLTNKKLWEDKHRFQLRYTLLRHTRRYMFGYILDHFALHQSLSDTERVVNTELIRDLSANLQAIDSGIEAEIDCLLALKDAMHSAEWWKLLNTKAIALLQVYSSDIPCQLSNVAELLRTFGKLLTDEGLVEQAFVIDQLYTMSPEDGLACFVSLLSTEFCRSWKTQYMALAYIEWGMHRGHFTKHALGSLKPTLQRLADRDHPKVNEKLMTVLAKLRSLKLFGDIRAQLSTASDDSDLLYYLAALPDQFLDPEPETASISNSLSEAPTDFVDSEYEAALEALQARKELTIVGAVGSGKRSLAYAISAHYAGFFDVVWVCNAESDADFEISMAKLAQEFGFKSHKKDVKWALPDCLKQFSKVLIVLVNCSLSERSYNSIPEHCYLIKTSTAHSLGALQLEGKTTEKLVYYMQNHSKQLALMDLSELRNIANYMGGLHFCARLLCAFADQLPAVNATDLMENLSAKYLGTELPRSLKPVRADPLDTSVLNLIKLCIARAQTQHPQLQDFLCLVALFVSSSVPLRLVLAVTKLLGIDFPSCKQIAENYRLIAFKPDESVHMHELVRLVTFHTSEFLKIARDVMHRAEDRLADLEPTHYFRAYIELYEADITPSQCLFILHMATQKTWVNRTEFRLNVTDVVLERVTSDRDFLTKLFMQQRSIYQFAKRLHIPCELTTMKSLFDNFERHLPKDPCFVLDFYLGYAISVKYLGGRAEAALMLKTALDSAHDIDALKPKLVYRCCMSIIKLYENEEEVEIRGYFALASKVCQDSFMKSSYLASLHVALGRFYFTQASEEQAEASLAIGLEYMKQLAHPRSFQLKKIYAFIANDPSILGMSSLELGGSSSTLEI